MTIAGEVLLLIGSSLVFLSAVGVVRFHDVLTRLHSLSKASTMGFVVVVLGSLLLLDSGRDRSFAILAAVVQVMTVPVGSNLISRATYRASGIEHQVDSTDELADDLASGAVD